MAARTAVQVHAVAVVGKQNNPLFVSTLGAPSELKFLYVVHSSLDIIDEKVATGTKNAEMYLGLLHSVENMRVYGYLTNTKIKLIVVLSAVEGQVKDADVRLLFQRLHQEYVHLTYSPFYQMDTLRITSPRFAANVQSIVQGFTAA